MKKGLSDNYHLKAQIERLFGHKQFLKIKDYPSLKQWKKTLRYLLKSYEKAIKQSIGIYPNSFYDELNTIFSQVDSLSNNTINSEEELFSAMVAIQSKIIFILLGGIRPCDARRDRTLSSNWDCSIFRTTQIIQSKEQKYKYIKELIERKLTREEFDLFSEEYRILKDDQKIGFYEWIQNEKMGIALNSRI